jgi:DNA-binding IclR family transcriptional regulator
MTDKNASSLSRMLSVLDLFSDQQLNWTAEDIATTLDVSLPTGYRYVKLLADAGLLQRTADSHYTLGPRVIVLDHYIRMADPVLQQAVPFMKELVAATGFDCVLSGLYGNQVLDTHREFGAAPATLNYGRGRPRPLFLGGAPKVILAGFGPAQLHKILDTHAQEVAAAGLPTDWPAFRRHYSAIRKRGHYLSIGELEPHLAAMAAPIYRPDGDIAAAISLVSTVARMSVMDQERLAQLLGRAAQDITARLP